MRVAERGSLNDTLDKRALRKKEEGQRSGCLESRWIKILSNIVERQIYFEGSNLCGCNASLEGINHGALELDVIGQQEIKQFDAGGISCKSFKGCVLL